jgi:hypothetical protein
MWQDSTPILTKRVGEVALWCALQELTAFHQDSPEEARRRELMKEASRLLATASPHIDRDSGWRQTLFHPMAKLMACFTKNPGSDRNNEPEGEGWTRAMNLIREADPDTLAPLENQLRSPKLKPPDSIGSSYSEESRQEMVDAVIDLRSSLIRAQLLQEPASSPSRLRGRLLFYVPSENVSDGASKFASNGFFDAYDCPPWDLWLRYSDRILTSWVPEALFPLAQAGIDANPIDCIRWAD